MTYTNEEADKQLESYKAALIERQKKAAERKKAEEERQEQIRKHNAKMQEMLREDEEPKQGTRVLKAPNPTAASDDSTAKDHQPHNETGKAANAAPSPKKKLSGTRPNLSNRPTGPKHTRRPVDGSTSTDSKKGQGLHSPKIKKRSSARPSPLTDKGDAPDSKDDADNADYKVGYGKPPKHTQFKKGQSGNKSGRPKGSKNSDMILEETMSTKLKVRENGSTREISVREGMIKKQAELALKGDQRAIKFLFDRDDQLGAKLKAQADAAEAEGGDELEGAEMNIMEELKRQIIEEHETNKSVEEQADD